jgi:hypothetical protein
MDRFRACRLATIRPIPGEWVVRGQNDTQHGRCGSGWNGGVYSGRIAGGEQPRLLLSATAKHSAGLVVTINFARAFSTITKKAGLGHWHPHELRHSGASLMLAQGTELHVVSEILGHSSISITKDIYGHLVEGHKRKASTAISAALLGTPPPQRPRPADKHGLSYDAVRDRLRRLAPSSGSQLRVSCNTRGPVRFG